MKVFSKAMAVLCGLTLAASAVPVISAGAVESAAQAETNDAATQANKKPEKGQKRTEKCAEKNVKIGKVTAVNGNVITVSLGEFTSQRSDVIDDTADGIQSKKQRKAAEIVTDNAGNQSAQKRSPKKSTNDNSGDNSSEQSQMSQKRRGKSGRSGTFTENGTTLDVTITDRVTIEKKGEAVAVADVNEGDLVKLEYDENGNLVKLKFAKNKRGHGKGTKADDSQKITGQAAES